MRTRLLLALVTLVASVLATAATGLAQPDLADVSPHRHWLVNATGERVQIGPRVCDDPTLQGAFNQFHTNVHVGADGLHDHQGGEIASSKCG